jgi:hypothetical protein
VVVDVVVTNTATIVVVVGENECVLVDNIMSQKYKFLEFKKAFLKFLRIF